MDRLDQLGNHLKRKGAGKALLPRQSPRVEWRRQALRQALIFAGSFALPFVFVFLVWVVLLLCLTSPARR